MILTLNQKLVILCVLLTVPALFVSNRMKNDSEPQKYIGSLELAEMIKSRESIRLIDLRSAKEYNEFHLPGADNVDPKDFLSNPEILEEQVVFYSGEDPLAVDLWEQLPDDMKMKSNILYGGAVAWYDRILYPKIPLKSSIEDSMLVRHIKDLSRFYGGHPEFVNDPDILNYYHKDLQGGQQKTPQINHKTRTLKRQGC